MSTTIQIPDDLAGELDRLAGATNQDRAAYAVDVLWLNARRLQQREALRISAGSWNQADHPELAHGGAAYVERSRSEPDERYEGAQRKQNLMATILLDSQ